MPVPCRVDAGSDDLGAGASPWQSESGHKTGIFCWLAPDWTRSIRRIEHLGLFGVRSGSIEHGARHAGNGNASSVSVPFVPDAWGRWQVGVYCRFCVGGVGEPLGLGFSRSRPGT